MSTEPNRSYDVVIIGAGLAGLQCAKLLAISGAKVLLVDRKHDLTKGIHTTGIFVRKTLEDFDFPPGTLGPPVRNVSVYSPKLRRLKLEGKNDEFRVGKMGKLYEAILRECIDRGVEFASGTRYVGSTSQDLSSCSIVKLEKSGVTYEVKMKVLVGADGANSRVARDLRLDENQKWIVGYEEVFHGVPLCGAAELHCFLDSEIAPGYLAWITNDGEEVHIGVGGYPAKFDPREAIKKFREAVAPKFVDLTSAKLVETRGGRIPVGGVLRRIANENGLLIGDAAGAVSPLTAGGLDPCLRLSAIAARVIIERLRADDSKVLLNYSGSIFRSRFISRRWMRRLISVFTNQTVLELGCAFLRSAAGKRVAKHVFFGRGSFPDVSVEFAKAKTAAD